MTMTRQELEDLIANAIDYPDRYVPRKRIVGRWGETTESAETVAQWVARAVLAALRSPDDEPHVLIVRDDLETWSLEHPLQCRFDDLGECEVHKAAMWLDGPPAKPGRHVVTVDGDELVIGEAVTP